MTQKPATTATPAGNDTPAVPPQGNPVSLPLVVAIVVVIVALGAGYHRRRRR